MEYFLEIVLKGDNLPIAAMIPIVLFFTWLALKQGFANDRLIRQGRSEEILDEMRR